MYIDRSCARIALALAITVALLSSAAAAPPAVTTSGDTTICSCVIQAAKADNQESEFLTECKTRYPDLVLSSAEKAKSISSILECEGKESRSDESQSVEITSAEEEVNARERLLNTMGEEICDCTRIKVDEGKRKRAQKYMEECSKSVTVRHITEILVVQDTGLLDKAQLEKNLEGFAIEIGLKLMGTCPELLQ